MTASMLIPCRITGVAGDAVHGETADSVPFTIDLGDRDASLAVANTLVAAPQLVAALRAIADFERESDEWDAVDRIVPAMRALARAALAKAGAA